MSFNIKGIFAPVFTPMDDTGHINFDIIPDYLHYLKSAGHVNGILVGGTTGEAALLNVAERKLLLESWIEAARPLALKVISQVGGAPLPDVLELAKFSQGLKADAVMTLPELYYKPRTVDQLVDYLGLVSKAAGNLPLIYYHFPLMSGVDVNMRDFYQSARSRIPNFKGMKADLNVALQIADSLSPDHTIFIANHHLAQAALMGYESSIATVTNLFPNMAQNIVENVKNGDVKTVRKLQFNLNQVVDDITSHGDFVPAMKAAMEVVSGVKVGPPRRPLTRLEETNLHLLKKQLMLLGLC